ncbi:MAG: FHA domain-containing protein [Sedimentisphaerales bacterium]|nr:FHA domain-containing protein [Sedimentisphaerales bacterium]
MLTLSILQGPDKGRSFDIDLDEVLIGRDAPDAPLGDNTVSRRHAVLRNADGVWMIRDLNSANGTYVNGVKVAGTMEVEVKLGDQLRCGTTLLVVGGTQVRGIAGELGDSLRIDADGNIVESAIMTRVPSMDDSVIIAGPETSNAVGNLRLLYELSTAISSIFDRQQLLDRVMDMIFDNLPADRGFVLMRENEDEELKPMVVRYRRKEHSGEIAISHTIVNHVMEKQEGVICSNAMRDPRFAKGKSVHDYAIHSALCVPITVHSRNIGVIYIDTTVATHTYNPEQLRLLTAIGFQTGMALEHARLYEAGVKAERLAATGETVAFLSHGIKNILQSLQSAADLVEMGLTRDKIDMAKKGWSIMQRNLTRVQNLVLNMLAYSKVRQPNLAVTQFNHAVEEAVELLSTYADGKHVAVIADVDEHLPPIAVDADGMQQVMLNLVLNAIDAVEPGQGVVTIKTAYDESGNNMILSVGDNGKGIPEKHLEKIFDAFHSEKGQGGTGLGLAVVKKIVEEHKGQVSVTSSPSEGTTFTVTIPASSEVSDSGGTAGPA